MSDSLLEQARARAAARRERQITVAVPDLDMTLLCDVPTDAAAVEKLQANAKAFDRGKAVATHFARALVAEQTREIHISGVAVTVNGQPVSFRDPELHAAMGVPDAKSAVVELIGADGYVIDVATELMAEAGLAGGDDPI